MDKIRVIIRPQYSKYILNSPGTLCENCKLFDLCVGIGGGRGNICDTAIRHPLAYISDFIVLGMRRYG